MKNVVNSLKAGLLACVVLFAASCNDEETPSKTDLLTARPWKESKAEIKTDAGTFDISASYIDDCEKDNTYTFSKDGTFSFDAGADDCDGDEEDYTGTWSWKENETVLSTVVDGDTDNSKVLEITSTTIKIDAGKISYDLDGDGNDDTEVSLINTYSNK